MVSPLADLQRTLDHAPAISIICAERVDWGMHAASACVAAGFQAMAVGAQTPQATQIIASLVARPDMVIGLCRALTRDHVVEAHEAGASFIMSPTVALEVGAAAREAGLVWIAGAITPTEVAQAIEAGADMVQLYPIGTAGGVLHLRLMADLFPDLPLIAAGGVGGDRMTAFFDAGARAVALSEAIYSRDLMAAGDHMAIRNHAATAHQLATQYGRSHRGGA